MKEKIRIVCHVLLAVLSIGVLIGFEYSTVLLEGTITTMFKYERMKNEAILERHNVDPAILDSRVIIDRFGVETEGEITYSDFVDVYNAVERTLYILALLSVIPVSLDIHTYARSKDHRDIPAV